MRLAGLQCEPYYSKAYQIGYTTRTRLFLRPDFTGFESFLQLMDKIETSLSTIDNIGGLGLCFYQYDIYLNISEEKLLERETLSQTSASHIDLRVTYCQLFKRESAVFSEMQNMLNVYEKISNFSAYVSVEYIAENYESVSDLEWMDLKLKLLPPYYPLHIMVYEITKGKLAKVTIRSHIMMMPSQHPIPVNYLQMCAKVVLHVDSREITRHMEENNAPVVKVLGEKVDPTEVIVSADGDKIMICAEKYIELVEKQENRALNEDEKPTSRAMKIQQFKHFTFIPVFLVMKDHFGR